MRIRLLLPLMLLVPATACERSPTDPGTPVREYRVGSEYTFNVQVGEGKLCSGTDRDERTGRVISISQRAIIVADVNNPSGGFTEEEYRQFGRVFDSLVWPVTVANFGEPFDIDNNGRVVIFFTRAVNEQTPRGQTWYVGGFMTARDLFPLQRTRTLEACAGTNYAEMLYMLVPDPTGAVNGNVRRKDGELRSSVAVIGHELQHLINASRRLYGGRTLGSNWNEEVWLNEGLSHIAEELLGYGATDLAPRQNIDADRVLALPQQDTFWVYFGSNVDRLRRYLENPDTASPISDGNSLTTRGAVWQFLRYAADRKGGSEAALWRGLIDSGSAGLNNLRTVLGAEPMEWMSDWAVSNFTDDGVPGIPPRFEQLSWNFRGLYPRIRIGGGPPLGVYPLKTRNLTDNSQMSLSIRAGSAAYLRFRVPSAGRGEVRTSPDAASCQQGGPALDLQVGEAVTLSAAQIGVVCVNGGIAGADFVYVPFNASSTGNRVVNVEARGVQPVNAAAALALQAGASIGLSALGGGTGGEAPGDGWEARLRTREARELTALVPGAAAPGRVPEVSFQTNGTDELRVTLVRTR